MKTTSTQAQVGYTKRSGRPELDFYRTPEEATQMLLDTCKHLFEDGIVWECACGDGAMALVLERAGLTVLSSDIVDRGFGITPVNFLADNPPGEFKHIITNPPFRLAEEFTWKAAEFCSQTGGRFALFNRLQWLETVRRKAMFEACGLSRVVVSSRRLPFIARPDEAPQKTKSTVICFAWFVFDPSNPPEEPKLSVVDYLQKKQEQPSLLECPQMGLEGP